jgi:hypothetical protein
LCIAESAPSSTAACALTAGICLSTTESALSTISACALTAGNGTSTDPAAMSTAEACVSTAEAVVFAVIMVKARAAVSFWPIRQ